jgi:hypothetical protein
MSADGFWKCLKGTKDIFCARALGRRIHVVLGGSRHSGGGMEQSINFLCIQYILRESGKRI